MFTKLREPLGTAGLVVAIIALVFALGGGAWAITASVSGKHHKQPLKAKRHARGTRGPQGPAGPEGPEGPAGVNGKNGTNGKAGANGTNGTPGKSVVSGEEPAGENCEQGGYWFEIQGTGIKQYICKGGGGSGGGGGGSGGTTLAPGDTETGLWSFLVPPGGWEGEAGTEVAWVTMSFPLRTSFNSGNGYKFRWIGQEFWLEPGEEWDRTDCPGSTREPAAEPGFLCVYAEAVSNQTSKKREPCILPGVGGLNADVGSGAVMGFCAVDPAEATHGYGSWAVTAREE
jgi:hypothetical protein